MESAETAACTAFSIRFFRLGIVSTFILVRGGSSTETMPCRIERQVGAPYSDDLVAQAVREIAQH